MAAAWLAPVLSNLASNPETGTSVPLVTVGTLVTIGTGAGLVPLLAGLVWWPWLRPALSRGLSPAQVRAVGWTYVLGGAAGGLGTGAMLVLLIEGAEGSGNVLPGLLGLLGVVIVGAFLAVPGWRLIGFGRSLDRARRRT